MSWKAFTTWIFLMAMALATWTGIAISMGSLAGSAAGPKSGLSNAMNHFAIRQYQESDLPAIRKIYGNDEFARPALLRHYLCLAEYLADMLSVPCF